MPLVVSKDSPGCKESNRSEEYHFFGGHRSWFVNIYHSECTFSQLNGWRCLISFFRWSCSWQLRGWGFWSSFHGLIIPGIGIFLRASMEPPAQKELIEQSLAKGLGDVGDSCFVLCRKWWKVFLSYLKNVGEPDQIDNQTLFKAGTLRKHLTENMEYLVVSKRTWDLLHGW